MMLAGSPPSKESSEVSSSSLPKAELEERPRLEPWQTSTDVLPFSPGISKFALDCRRQVLQEAEPHHTFWRHSKMACRSVALLLASPVPQHTARSARIHRACNYILPALWQDTCTWPLQGPPVCHRHLDTSTPQVHKWPPYR